MQSLVEDVNSAVVTYRQVGVRAREILDVEKATFAFNGMKSKLLDDYAIEYSEYVTLDDVRKEYAVIECTNCDATIKVGKEVMYDMAESGYRFVPTVVQTTSRRYVVCKGCNTSVYFNDSDVFVQRESGQVNFIPYPPGLSNMMSHTFNASKFWTWFDAVWDLIEKRHFQQRLHMSRSEEEV